MSAYIVNITIRSNRRTHEILQQSYLLIFKMKLKTQTTLHTQLQGFTHSVVDYTIGLCTLRSKAFPSFTTDFFAHLLLTHYQQTIISLA